MVDMEAIVESTTAVKNVHDFVEMPKVGRIYRGTITVALLARLIKRGILKYSPRYQRGLRKTKSDRDPSEYEPLQPLTNPAIQINVKRAQEMAVKYLKGELYSASIIWNARKDPGESEPRWDGRNKELSIQTDITVPDTAHRHLNYYLLDQWKKDPNSVPATVLVNEKPVFKTEIIKLLEAFEPAKSLVFLEIYNLGAEQEGHLYDQFNNDSKKPDRAVGIELNRQKTPSRRFIDALMNTSPIFAETEVETRSNTIGSDSRKFATISTIVTAAEDGGFRKLLIDLEGANDGSYRDLVEFFGKFFEEYARVFPELQPGTGAIERQKIRKESFTVSNIMLHPLFRMAKDIWKEYHYVRHADWRDRNDWKDAIAKLNVQVDGAEGGKVGIMHRNNPAWRGKVLTETWGPDGLTGYSLSNTRQTRDAAYKYMLDVTGLNTLLHRDTKASNDE